METGIEDTSNNGVYHNRRFKEQAEAHGLTVDHHEKYGWTITSPSEELLDFIIFQGWQDIQMGERLAWSDMAGTGAGSRAPGSSQTGAPNLPRQRAAPGGGYAQVRYYHPEHQGRAGHLCGLHGAVREG